MYLLRHLLAAVVNYGSILLFLFLAVKVFCYCKFKDAPTPLSATVFKRAGSGKPFHFITIVAFWISRMYLDVYS
jgi:hypothetical protein